MCTKNMQTKNCFSDPGDTVHTSDPGIWEEGRRISESRPARFTEQIPLTTKTTLRNAVLENKNKTKSLFLDRVYQNLA